MRAIVLGLQKMNILRNVENIVRVREELYELQRKVEHLRRELDGTAAEIIGFLKDNGHLEKKDRTN